ncbi:MAG: OmpA family protein, partial [SAR324 cluster bacterium]|nr:OmpA family protein [SAR324 cluster bacterium]
IASTDPEDSDDLCERAPSLILEMSKKLLEMEALPDPRLRDSRNDELFPTIYFDFDQSLIKPDFKDQLQNQTPCVLEQLEKNEDLIVQVEGHADERGNDEYNIALGHRRANSVLGLVKVYVTDPSRIQTISYGEEFPAVQGSNREAWSKNRRVVFTILLKSQ